MAKAQRFRGSGAKSHYLMEPVWLWPQRYLCAHAHLSGQNSGQVHPLLHQWSKGVTLISEWERIKPMANNPNNAFQASTIRPAEAEDYGKVVNHLLASRHAGRSQIWPRSELVQPHEPSYFRPDTNLYRDTLKKDRRNGKELEYVHSSGSWIEQAICAFELFKSSDDPAEQGRLLSIVERSMRASKEILAMRTSHFQAILTKGPAMARQLADLVEAKVEAKHSQVQSDSYAAVYQELSAKYVIEAAKTIARDHNSAPNKGAGE